MGDSAPTRLSLIAAAVTAAMRAAGADPFLRRATSGSLTEQTTSCFKGLLPRVKRQPHVSRSATAHLIRVLEVDEPFLTTLATIGDDVALTPEQVEPATRIAGWAAHIAVTAYQHCVRTRDAAETVYVERHGELANDNTRRSVGGKWLTAVRVTALNLVADGQVDIEDLDHLAETLDALGVERVWTTTTGGESSAAAAPPRAVTDAEAAAVRELAVNLLFSNRSRFLGVISRVSGLTGTDAEDVLQEAGRKILSLPRLGPHQVNLGYLTVVVKTTTLDVVNKRRRGSGEQLVSFQPGEQPIKEPSIEDDVSHIEDPWRTDDPIIDPTTGQPLRDDDRGATVRVLTAMVRAGAAQGVSPMVLDAHAHVADALLRTRPTRLRGAVERLYVDHYRTTLNRPPAVAALRAQARLSELRYAARHHSFPPPELG